MLERVALVPGQLDLGAIAEAIVYYGKVEFVCLNGHIADLVERVGIETAIRLAESDIVDFSYKLSSSTIHTDEYSLYPHSVWTITPHKTASGKRIRGPEDELVETFQRKFGRGVVSLRDIRRLAGALTDHERYDSPVQKYMMDDVRNAKFIERALQTVLATKVPGYPNPYLVKVICHESAGNFIVNSNVNYELATKIFCSGDVDSNSKITPAYLVAPLLQMNEAMLYAGDRKCDIWADETCSSLLRLRVNTFAKRTTGSRENIDHFQESKFLSRSFSSAINNGDRTMSDVLDFAESNETRKFKRWISESKEGSDLLSEYEKSRISQSKLASSLPFKAAKLVVFASGGLALETLIGGSGVAGAIGGAIASGAVLSTVEEMLASRMSIGWRPNQWVTNAAGPFLRAQDDS